MLVRDTQPNYFFNSLLSSLCNCVSLFLLTAVVFHRFLPLIPCMMSSLVVRDGTFILPRGREHVALRQSVSQVVSHRIMLVLVSLLSKYCTAHASNRLYVRRTFWSHLIVSLEAKQLAMYSEVDSKASYSKHTHIQNPTNIPTSISLTTAITTPPSTYHNPSLLPTPNIAMISLLLATIPYILAATIIFAVVALMIASDRC